MRIQVLGLYLFGVLGCSLVSAGGPTESENCGKRLLPVELNFEYPPVAVDFPIPDSASSLTLNPEFFLLPTTRRGLGVFEGLNRAIPTIGNLIGLLQADAKFRESMEHTSSGESTQNWQLLREEFVQSDGDIELKVACGALDFLRDYFTAHRLCMHRMSQILESDPRIAALERVQHKHERDTLMLTILRHGDLPVRQVIDGYLYFLRTRALPVEKPSLPMGIRSRRSEYPSSRQAFMETGLRIAIPRRGGTVSAGLTDEKDLHLIGRIALFMVDREGQWGFGTIVARREGKSSVEIDILDEVNQRLHTRHSYDRPDLIVEPKTIGSDS